jgi:hypothetical protein
MKWTVQNGVLRNAPPTADIISEQKFWDFELHVVRSEDAVRRAFLKGEDAEYARWLHAHLDSSYEELLKEPWILDMDGTVKPLYGHQEQAVRGYNPTKQGRPSHVYQTYFIAAIRMVLDVEVQAGNQAASIYAQPGLWAWLDRRPREQWPKLVRGISPGEPNPCWWRVRKGACPTCLKSGRRRESSGTLRDCSGAPIGRRPAEAGKGCPANCK